MNYTEKSILFILYPQNSRRFAKHLVYKRAIVCLRLYWQAPNSFYQFACIYVWYLFSVFLFLAAYIFSLGISCCSCACNSIWLFLSHIFWNYFSHSFAYRASFEHFTQWNSTKGMKLTDFTRNSCNMICVCSTTKTTATTHFECAPLEHCIAGKKRKVHGIGKGKAISVNWAREKVINIEALISILQREREGGK